MAGEGLCAELGTEHDPGQLDVELDPIPNAERHRLIARLVTDFRQPYTQDRVRSVLKERWKRAEVRRTRRK